MTETKIKKALKKKWDFPIGFAPMSEKDAKAEMEKFFTSLEEKYKNVPEAEVERGAKKIRDFIKGEINWAGLFDFTPDMLYQMAEYGFTQFKVGRYDEAERVFKVLTVLDWNNAYYHSVMGSVLQHQKRYGEAIAEYSQAIEIDSNDIVSRVNRGEVFLQHGLLDEASEDFSVVIRLDSDGKDKFINRAKMLVKQVEKIRKEKGKKGA